MKRNVAGSPGRRLAFALTMMGLSTPAVAFAEPVTVIVPDADNLQYMSFWMAEKTGGFAAEGLEVSLKVPDAPKDAIEWIRRGDGDAFVMPPPISLELAAEKLPFVLVANLLKNNPIDLVIRSGVAKERGISRSQPLKERLLALKGLKVGVAPGPPPRLEALFTSVGLVAKDVVEIVIVPGKMQNTAFAEGRVDALYAHTPYLEKALVEQGAEVVVDQAGGEVPALARMQIHALGVRTAFRTANPAVVEKLVTAIAKAERRLTTEPEASIVDALVKAFPAYRRENLATIVHLYRPAIPEGPMVSAAGLASTLPLYPMSKTAPSFALADLAAFVDDSFTKNAIAAARATTIAKAPTAEAASTPAESTTSTKTRIYGLLAIVGAAGALAFLTRKRRA